MSIKIQLVHNKKKRERERVRKEMRAMERERETKEGERRADGQRSRKMTLGSSTALLIFLRNVTASLPSMRR